MSIEVNVVTKVAQADTGYIFTTTEVRRHASTIIVVKNKFNFQIMNRYVIKIHFRRVAFFLWKILKNCYEVMQFVR